MLKALTFVGLLLLIGCAATTGPVALPGPADIKITPAPASLPADLAAFSGTWEGTWTSPYGWLLSRLIVESVDTDSARVVYIWGDDPRGRFEGGWSRNRAKVSPGGVLEFGSSQIKFKFVMAKDKTSIEGEREQGGIIATVTMRKVGQ
jgi:hypothetical protein